MPIFAWHLVLVSKRSERRQAGVEILGSGVLALSAPAAYWTGTGKYDPFGWWLFLLTWSQAATSIVYAYLRLMQSDLTEVPEILKRFQLGCRALLYTTFNLLIVCVFSFLEVLPPLIPIPFALQWAESIYGSLRPAIGVKPTRIGIRQLIVSSIFTLLFIFTWNP